MNAHDTFTPKSASRFIVQLVPPGTGGIRDYAECLQREWETMGIDSQLMALSQTAAAERSLADRLDDMMRSDGRACSLVLHFSGYGFHPRGLCFWLASEIEAARAKLGQRLRLVTMFHELFASGPPWGSAFWLSRFQARIASRIAKASDALRTNTGPYSAWLAKQFPPTVAVEVQAVFSNVGEPKVVKPQNERVTRVVVFGSAATRHRALEPLRTFARRLSEQGIVEIVEVGPGPAFNWVEPSPPHRHVGRLGLSELRELLEDSAYGLIDYPETLFGKSGVIAAYAAHGCVVLNMRRVEAEHSELRDRTHFFNLLAGESIPCHATDRSLAAGTMAEWYRGHSLRRHATSIAESCCSVPYRGALSVLKSESSSPPR
jgi:hypothetical protein